MSESAANLVVLLGAIYAALGLLFAVYFVSAGVHRLDPLTRHAGAGFRLLILPGAALFWPLLLGRCLRVRQ